MSLLLAGCTGDGIYPVSETVTGGATPVLQTAMALEKLDATYIDNEILAMVISNGCTRADQFSVEHRVVENSCVLIVQRDTPDYCKRASFARQIQIVWPLPEECRNSEIVFANPVLSED